MASLGASTTHGMRSGVRGVLGFQPDGLGALSPGQRPGWAIPAHLQPERLGSGWSQRVRLGVMELWLVEYGRVSAAWQLGPEFRGRTWWSPSSRSGRRVRWPRG